MRRVADPAFLARCPRKSPEARWLSEVFFNHPWSVGEVRQAAIKQDKRERHSWKLRAFEFVAVNKYAANSARLGVKRVVARPHAHPVMPRHWKNPPHKGPENGLSHCEGENVAFPGEEPAHCRATDKCQWHENRIGPVQSGKNGAGQ